MYAMRVSKAPGTPVSSFATSLAKRCATSRKPVGSLLYRFQLSNLKLRPTLEQSAPDESARGIPLASPRWQLRLKPTGLLSGAFMREFLTSIENISLRFNYEAFNLPP